MTYKLLSFEFVPRGKSGWSSELLKFGKNFTIVGGPNGSGKTPILKGIMAALGHEILLPPEIVNNCLKARLRIEVGGEQYTLSRELSGDESNFNLTVENASQSPIVFRKNVDFSKWFTSLFDAPYTLLTTKKHQESPLYCSILFPIFWVNQDHGWASAYWVPSNRDFILDQRQEVIRYMLGLTPRHPFRPNDEYDAAKKVLEQLTRSIELQLFMNERLYREVDLEPDDLPIAEKERNAIKEELQQYESGLETLRSVANKFDLELTELEEQRRLAARDLARISGRREQLELTLVQIDEEVEVLSANVVAAELLRKFCENPQCGVFGYPKESYGRALLFLKDQIKDMQTAKSILSSECEMHENRVIECEVRLKEKRLEQDVTIKQSSSGQLFGAVQALTKKLVDLELRIARFEQYQSQLEKYQKLLDRKEQAKTRADELRPKGGPRQGTDIAEARMSLVKSFESWLGILNVQNAVGGTQLTDDFVPIVGGVEFTPTSHHSGSTRTRIVLAFHAAVLEVALQKGGNHPGWLILDTPKQQELKEEDFQSYLQHLGKLGDRYNIAIQVIFSTVNLATSVKGATKWMPKFGSEDNPRYLDA